MDLPVLLKGSHRLAHHSISFQFLNVP
jgi:hypothetical protein